MRFVVIGVIVWLLVGCASSASDWTKAGASEQQVGQDTADCLGGAQMIIAGAQGTPRTVIQQDRYRRCMLERGYAETPRK